MYDLIFQCPATLPMGFSWSVYLCLCAGETLFRRATRLDRCPLVNDRDKAPIFHEFIGKECDDTFGYVYVDNIGLLETSRSKAEDLMKKVDGGWLPLVLASDAEWGGGVTSSARSSEAAKVGCVAERSRFRRGGEFSARGCGLPGSQ